MGPSEPELEDGGHSIDKLPDKHKDLQDLLLQLVALNLWGLPGYSKSWLILL